MAPEMGAGMKRGSGQGWMFTMLVEMGGNVSHSQSKTNSLKKAFPAFIPACYVVCTCPVRCPLISTVISAVVLLGVLPDL